MTHSNLTILCHVRDAFTRSSILTLLPTGNSGVEVIFFGKVRTTTLCPAGPTVVGAVGQCTGVAAAGAGATGADGRMTRC